MSSIPRYQDTILQASETPAGFEWEAMHDEIAKAADAINTAPVRGYADILNRLEVLWSLFIDDRTEALHGAQPDSDQRTKMFWDLIIQVRALTNYNL